MSRRRRNQVKEPNNYQDKFSDKEFEKGFDKGRSESRTSRKFPSEKVKPEQKFNDPTWYYNSEQILRDVASFSFMKPLGYPLRYQNQVGATVGSNTVMMNGLAGFIPGVMSIQIGLTPGISTDSQSPLNLAATNVYSFVRHKNSGSRNYDSPDLMLYLLAMDSLFSCWNWMKRLYGMASTYSATNKYMPRAWFALNNVDFEDIIQNLADFRGWLNVKASEIAAFCVPAVMPYSLRHAWLFQNVYKDADTDRAQQYIYVPSYFYQFSETSSGKGGSLLAQDVCMMNSRNVFTHATFKLKDLKGLLNGMLDAVNYSEDIGIMSGDILKAYGDGGLYTLSEITDDYKVEPVYSKEVLTQIENSTLSPISLLQGSGSYFNITQDPNTNFLVFAPHSDIVSTSDLPLVLTQLGVYLNFHWENPTPQDVMVATRLASTFTVQYTDSKHCSVDLTSCGSEVVTGYEIATFTFASTSEPISLNPVVPGSSTPMLTTLPILNSTLLFPTNYLIRNFLPVVTALAAFDWGPQLWLAIGPDSENKIALCGKTTDFDVMTSLNVDNLEALNLTAILAEFNVPN